MLLIKPGSLRGSIQSQCDFPTRSDIVDTFPGTKYTDFIIFRSDIVANWI